MDILCVCVSIHMYVSIYTYRGMIKGVICRGSRV